MATTGDMPPKRLVLCFDGTDNTAKDRTNVWRLHRLIADKDAGGRFQDSRYFKGVGTSLWSSVSGSVFGRGASDRVREGYDWLADNYEPGAHIFIFGFSRGAFIARSLIQMIATCGLPEKSCQGWRAKVAFDYYSKIVAGATGAHAIYRLAYWQRNGGKPSDFDDTCEQLDKLVESRQVGQVKIRMVGLWDTVGALGKRFLRDDAPIRGMSGRHNVRLPTAVESAYHAVAIDEHRPMFHVTLWREFLPKGQQQSKHSTDLFEQRWFPGAHSDVGGGYGDDRLPDLSLAWMLDKARCRGLEFAGNVVPESGAYLAPAHDSFELFAAGALDTWDKLIPGKQRYYRRIGRLVVPAKTTHVPPVEGYLQAVNETIDGSVEKRWDENEAYRPQNLVDHYQVTCNKRVANLVQRTARIYAKEYWNRTGVFLTPGVTYEVNVVPNLGEPLIDKRPEFTAHSISGADWDSVAHKSFGAVPGKRYKDAKWFELIGTVDEKYPFVVKDGGKFVVDVPGELVCYFNDVRLKWLYLNNSGWRVLDVTRTASSQQHTPAVAGPGAPPVVDPEP